MYEDQELWEMILRSVREGVETGDPDRMRRKEAPITPVGEESPSSAR